MPQYTLYVCCLWQENVVLSSEVGDDLDQVEAVQRTVDDFQKVHVHFKLISKYRHVHVDISVARAC